MQDTLYSINSYYSMLDINQIYDSSTNNIFVIFCTIYKKQIFF